MKHLRRFLLRVVIYCVVGYLTVIVLFMFFETGLVYPAPPASLGTWDPAVYDAEDVVFAANDGTKLHGWYFEHPNPQGVMLFCHGNGEHLGVLGSWADQLRTEHGVSLFVFDYRGYGKSEGSPHQAGVLSDGEAAQRWLAEHEGVPPEEIILYGRSLGGAVAVHLAAKHGARGLIIERTFDSLVGVAASLYPWLPVRLLMRNRYESIHKIRNYDGPLLQLHGSADELVPVSLAQRLFDAAPSMDKRFVAMPNIGHNDPTPPEFEREIGAFIDSLD